MRTTIAMTTLVACLCAGCANTSTRYQSTNVIATYPKVSALDLSGIRSLAPEKGESGTIRYTLSAPARVRIRIVDSDTPGIILRTLLDWEERPEGEQVEPWDGKDQHGQPVNPRRVSVLVVAEPRPQDLDQTEREALATQEHPEHKHFLHAPTLCSDLEVLLQTPTPGAVLVGIVHVKAALGARRGMPNGEYHVVIYLDGREVWDGRVNEAYVEKEWDTHNVPNGEHLLAVTFNDLHDHAGSDWLPVQVAN